MRSINQNDSQESLTSWPGVFRTGMKVYKATLTSKRKKRKPRERALEEIRAVKGVEEEFLTMEEGES